MKLSKIIKYQILHRLIKNCRVQSSYIYKFSAEEAKKYHTVQSDFLEIFCPLATHLKLSFRDIEKAIALYVFSGMHSNNIYLEHTIYAICLKIKSPSIYKSLLLNDEMTHKELAMKFSLLHSSFERSSGYPLFGMLFSWHQYMLRYKNENLNQIQISSIFPHLTRFPNQIPLNTLFSNSALKIDLSID